MENADDRTERNMKNPDWLWYITPIANRKMAVVHHAHGKKKNGEKKNGRGTSFPSLTEKWRRYITPIAKRRMVKRKMAAVHRAHREKKKQRKEKMAMVHHAHCKKKNGEKKNGDAGTGLTLYMPEGR
jgi:hypothetical protein